MNFDQFKAALKGTRLKTRAGKGALMVLVYGLSATEAAKEQKISKQAVSAAVKRLRLAHMELLGCPDGWQCVTVCVPKGEAVDKVRTVEDIAMKKAGLRCW